MSTVRVPEKRNGWVAGVSKGHYISVGIALITFSIGYGVLTSDVHHNTQQVTSLSEEVAELRRELKQEMKGMEIARVAAMQKMEDRRLEDAREIRQLMSKLIDTINQNERIKK